MQLGEAVNGEQVGQKYPDGHGHDQVNQHREANDQIEDQGALDGNPVGPPEESPIHNVNAHLQGNSRKDRQGDPGRQPGTGHNHQHQHHRPDDAGEG